MGVCCFWFLRSRIQNNHLEIMLQKPTRCHSQSGGVEFRADISSLELGFERHRLQNCSGSHSNIAHPWLIFENHA